jgi:hypothetical protein
VDRYSGGANYLSKIPVSQNIRACRFWIAAVTGRSSGWLVFASNADESYNWFFGTSHNPKNSVTESRGATVMSAPSRRPEIRRRRTRAEKVAKLRKRLAAASAPADQERLTAKLHRVGLVSPGNPLIKSA